MNNGTMENIKKEKKHSLPKGWEIKKLGEVCNKGSSNISQNKLINEKGIYPIFGASGFIKNISFYHNDKPYLSIVKDGSGIGRVTKMDAYTSVTGTLQYIYPKEGIDLNYLYYSLLSIDFKKYATGAAIPHIYFKDYKNEPFLWMPLSEQRRIVSILDKCFSAIERSRNNAEQNLKNAKEIFESYLKGVFENENWVTKTLNQISENLDSKRIPITKNKRKSGNIPYYGASGIVDYVADYIFDEDLLCISEDGANLLARTYPIAFSISGKTWVNNHAHVLKFSNLITQKFVETYINSIKIDDYVSGMAQPKLNQAMLNKITIPIPSLEEQQSIIQQLDALRVEIQKLEAIYHRKVVLLEELKKSILQKAFNGELIMDN